MNIEGVYVPVSTPFRADESIDWDGYAKVVEFLLDGGASGIVVAGTTGEYYALSNDERKQQFRAVLDQVGDRAQLIAGCNAGSTAECIDYAQTAQQLGYHFVMLAAPPTSLPHQHELAAHFIAVAEEGGLPIILYNYPARAGVEIGFECLDLLADHAGIVAIKESSSDFSRFLAMRKRYAGRITIMCGSDDQAADYFAWGVRSWLAGTGNVLPREHAEIMSLANQGDIAGARRRFDAIIGWVQHMELGQYNQKVKLGLGHQGIECGPVRRPLGPLADDVAADNLAALRSAIDAYRQVS